MSIKLTNTAKGIRGLHTKSGLLYFKAGETKEVEFASKAQEDRAVKLGFTSSADAEAEPVHEKPEGAEVDLKEQAESLGIKVDGRWSDERLQQEIDKKLAE